MDIIDLRKYSDDSTKIISCDNNKILFMKNEEDEEGFSRVLYSYNNKNLYRINESRIASCEGDNYSYFYDKNYVFTYAFDERGDSDIASVYSINISDGSVEKLCSFVLKKNEIFRIRFINQRYFIAYGSSYGIDKNHEDIDADIAGEYEYAFLYDVDENKKYYIKDKKVIFNISNNIFTFNSNDEEFLFFEEYYMEDYELEEAFKRKQRKSQYFRNSYRESVNVISMEGFISSIKNENDEIHFTSIYKTEISGNTRYFGRDMEHIYFRVKDFNAGIETVYSIDMDTLRYENVKVINESEMKFSKESTMWHDSENKEIYYININDNIVCVKEIFNNSLSLTYGIEKGDFIGVIEGNYLITNSFSETEDGAELYTHITDIKANVSEKYGGACEIYNDKLILL